MREGKRYEQDDSREIKSVNTDGLGDKAVARLLFISSCRVMPPILDDFDFACRS